MFTFFLNLLDMVVVVCTRTIYVLHLPGWKTILLHAEPNNGVSEDEVAHDMPIRIISCSDNEEVIYHHWSMIVDQEGLINDDNPECP